MVHPDQCVGAGAGVCVSKAARSARWGGLWGQSVSREAATGGAGADARRLTGLVGFAGSLQSASKWYVPGFAARWCVPVFAAPVLCPRYPAAECEREKTPGLLGSREDAKTRTETQAADAR
ncbi:MAG TPA: hypothetical protein DC058_05245 [Planctomycetaceae bacterium]|nr:hypothetical protein [Planctomycetaceae bacterium]